MSYQHGGETSTCALASASLDLILIFGVAWAGVRSREFIC